MSKLNLACLSSDKRTLEAEVWADWMSSTAQLTSEFLRRGDDPFSYNETASVSLLCSAANRIGLLSLAEYATTKRGKKDKRERASGRCDLYVAHDRRDWEFEFKQFFPWSTPRDRLDTWWSAALASARCLTAEGADFAVAGLIVTLTNVDEADLQRCGEVTASFARELQFAYALSSDDEDFSTTYIMLEVL